MGMKSVPICSYGDLAEKRRGGLDEAVINPIRKNYKRTELNVK